MVSTANARLNPIISQYTGPGKRLRGSSTVKSRVSAPSATAVAEAPVDSFCLGDLEVFPKELRARRGQQVVDLSLREVKLLTLFHRRRGEVLDRNTIFNVCWGEDYLPNSRTLDQQISQLRKRIEPDPKSPTIIRTVHGAGYRFDS